VRDYNSYLIKISVKSIETVHVFQNAYSSYRKFTDQDAWKLGEEESIDLIQEWINWNHKNGMSAVTIRNYFSQLNQFFYYMGLKLTSQDIKQNLNFPKKLHEERYAISMEEIQKIQKRRHEVLVDYKVLTFPLRCISHIVSCIFHDR